MAPGPADTIAMWLNINLFEKEYALVSLANIEKGELSLFSQQIYIEWIPGVRHDIQ